MSYTARAASFVASGTSIAFLIVMSLLILATDHIGAQFLGLALRYYVPVIGFLYVACQILPLCSPSYLRATTNHDNITSWLSLGGLILVVLFALTLLAYNEYRPYLVVDALGFAFLDALLLGVAAAVRKVVPHAAAPHP